MNPEDEAEDTAVVEVVKEEPKTNYSLSAKPAAKKSKADNFDSLFDDDDEDSPF